MSVEFIIGKKRADGVQGFTFPAMDAEITEAYIDKLKMRPALQRFAKELVRQNPGHSIYRLDPHQEIIGVKFHTITVTFILGKELPLTDAQQAARQKQRDEMAARFAAKTQEA